MRSPTFILGIILTIIFISAGDSFLPQPLASASYKTRTQLNEFLIGMFPDPSMDNLKPKRLENIDDFGSPGTND